MTATLSANNMDTSILVLSGFIKIISKRGAKGYFKVGQLRQHFNSKRGQYYFKVGAEAVISKWFNVYFKVAQLFQSEAKVISEWGSNFKVG